jgi:hypothetical protein
VREEGGECVKFDASCIVKANYMSWTRFGEEERSCSTETMALQVVSEGE